MPFVVTVTHICKSIVNFSVYRSEKSSQTSFIFYWIYLMTIVVIKYLPQIFFCVFFKRFGSTRGPQPGGNDLVVYCYQDKNKKNEFLWFIVLLLKTHSSLRWNSACAACGWMLVSCTVMNCPCLTTDSQHNTVRHKCTRCPKTFVHQLSVCLSVFVRPRAVSHDSFTCFYKWIVLGMQIID